MIFPVFFLLDVTILTVLLNKHDSSHKCLLHSAALPLSSASHRGDTGLIPGQFKVRYVVNKWQWESVIPPMAPSCSHEGTVSIPINSYGLCGGQSDDGRCFSERLCFCCVWFHGGVARVGEWLQPP
jgi:hypothetical protein